MHFLARCLLAEGMGMKRWEIGVEEGRGSVGVKNGEIKGQLPKMLGNGVLNNKILSISKMLKMSPYKGK